MVFLNACSVTNIEKSIVPNEPVTENNLKSKKIIPEKLIGTYVSFPANAVFYKNPQTENEQGVDRGIFINIDRLSGQKLVQPMFVVKRDKKGKKIVKKGKLERDHFLSPIVGIERNEDYIGKMYVEIMANDFGDIFSFERVPVKYSVRNINSNNGLRSLNRSVGTTQMLDARYVLECIRYSPGDQLPEGFFVEESTGFIFFNENGERYYITVGNSGTEWYVDARTKDHYIDMFYYMRTVDNQKIIQEAKSKKIGF